MTEQLFRLTRNEDFKRVRQRGKSLAHPLVVLVYLKNELSSSRIGISATRAVGNAVKRNRAKRRLRACIQKNYQLITPGFDIILIARQSTIEAEFKKLEDSINGLFRKAGLIKNEFERDTSE